MMLLYPLPASNSLYHSAVQEHRAQRGLSLTELAARCGLTRKTIERIENRRVTEHGRPLGFRPATATQVAQVLAVPINTLFADHPVSGQAGPPIGGPLP